jgi:threonine dehydrogenase-like Zn-dependent dehydrogenase
LFTQLLGVYDGGQAEYVRIPFANTVAALKIPYGIKSDEQVLFLSDILPTGYFGADIAIVQPGNVYIYIYQLHMLFLFRYGVAFCILTNLY